MHNSQFCGPKCVAGLRRAVLVSGLSVGNEADFILMWSADSIWGFVWADIICMMKRGSPGPVPAGEVAGGPSAYV
ncbi:MAG: hypothetical protein AMJ65_14030 [Phycisphaerae bacterium SG8_4]|nr:MAG: hypothetical protein AMJ65_14030 [Phycisphaerae bacterium SG8_4]